jgi:large subunit ribosomal protein L35
MKGPRSHRRRKKAPRVRALFDTMVPVAREDKKRIRRVLPYGEK